ncbi:DUF6562 domain-containing protein [Bacteroides gallinarum]|uniref:DUF6562 domain-containing protein n=2 Tax=Bacteroides gallinarum TaxID=376806 RepID=UPI00039BBDCE|nr:DUF6562 domain-containing protein [Bacteroides gallinarum]
MKKNFLGLILFFCMSLFVSCSDDDNTSGGDVGRMYVSAVLPASIATGQPDIAGHKLRCILELRTKGENAETVCHSEVVAEPVAEPAKLSLDIAVDAGSYDCLMWVDYIDADAAVATRTEGGTSRYADKYYDTSDLRNITVKDMNSLIDNEACDAFYYSGEIQKKDGEALVLEPELLRPFTKISVLEKNLREFNLLWGLTVSYEAAAKFDAGSGRVIEDAVAVNYAVSDFNPEMTPDGTLFSTYVFADGEDRNMGEIHLSFTTKQGVQHVIVPAGLIPVIRNQHIKVSGNMMAESPIEDTEFDITYDIDVDDWVSGSVEIATRPLKAKVGDFFYADGTYSSSYIEDSGNSCIGIVFAVAHDDGKASGDRAENYLAANGVQKLQEVNGWVIALKDIVDGNTRIAPAKVEALDVNGEPGSRLNDGKTDIRGFGNTEAFKSESIVLPDYPIAQAIISYEEAEATKAPANTSGWYWGAVKQYLVLAEEYAEVKVENGVVTDVELLAVGKSMQTLIDAGVAEAFSLDGEQFYWSSSVEKTKAADIGKLYRVGLSTSAKNYGQTAAWKTNDGRHARAVLTF